MENKAITKIAVFGERNSGTKWLSEVLRNTTDAEVITNSPQTGWKHANLGENAETRRRVRELLRKERENKDLNIVWLWISKDDFSWIDSMSRNPYHIQGYKKDSDPSRIINTRVSSVADTERLAGYVGKNLGDVFESYDNLISMLREKKSAFFDYLGSKTDTVFHVTYEDLLYDPRSVIFRIQEECSIARGRSLFDINHDQLDVEVSNAVNYPRRYVYLYRDHTYKFSVRDREFVRGIEILHL